LPAGTVKDRPSRISRCGLVVEAHVLEADGAALDDERFAPGGSSTSGCWIEHVHHALDVDHRLLDLAVHHAHEVERE
jgi:hypothetical protein